jgi:NAD(P)-dependent dehydrogenase (short-subunit alcohol dehydrogenase family)
MAQKAALVTGGAQGIGWAIARLLAERGYAVGIADVRAAKGLPFFRCDVSREPSVRACLRAALREFGRLDALVNNAGIAGPADPPIERLALARWN